MDIKVGRYGKEEGTIVPLDEECKAILEELWANHPGEGWSRIEGDKLFATGRHVATLKRTWQGWIEDAEQTWIAFIDMEGRPVFFLHRCSECHGIKVTAEQPCDGRCKGPYELASAR